MNNSLHDTWDNNVTLHLLMILLTAAIVWGFTCGLWSLSGATETGYISMVKDMLTGGSVFSASLGTQAADPNQPLAFWLWAAALKISGGEINSFAPRIISVSFAFITLVCTYVCGRRLISPKAGLYGAFILATCPIFLFYAVQAAPDMLFAGFIALSLTATLTRPPARKVGILRAVVIWGALAAAFLTNGVLALVMTLIFFILHAIARWRQFHATLADLRFIPGIIALVVVIGLWLLAGYRLGGGAYIQALLQNQLSLFMIKFPAEHWWYYFAQTGFILGIWVIGLILSIITLAIHKTKFLPRWYIWLFWFAPGFVLLCLAPEKNTAYILPVLPPVAIFIGYYISALAQFTTPGKKRIAAGFILKQVILAIGIIICVAALVIFVQPDFAWRQGFYINTTGIIAAFAGGLILIFFTLRRRDAYAQTGAMFGLVVVTLLLGNFILNATVNPALDVHMTSRYFSQNLTLMYPELTDIGLGVATGPDAGEEVPVNAERFHVYGNYTLKPVSYAPDMFASAQTPALPDFILISAQDYGKLTARPQLGGFAPVFWDTLENRFDLVLLKRQISVIIAPDAPMPLIYTVPRPLLLAGTTVMNAPSLPLQTLPSEEQSSPVVDEGANSVEPTDALPVATPQVEATEAPVTPANNETQAVEKTPVTDSTEPAADETPVADNLEPTVDDIKDETLIQNQHTSEELSAGHADAPPENTLAVPPDNQAASAVAGDETPVGDTTDTETITIDPETYEAPELPLVPAEENQPAAGAEDAADDDGTTGMPPEAALGFRLWAWFAPTAAHAQTPSEINATGNENAAILTNDNSTRAVTDNDGLMKDLYGATPDNRDDFDIKSLVKTIALNQPNGEETPVRMSPVPLNNEKCVLPQGFILINGVLRPYLSNCGSRNAALLDINTYQPNLVRIFSVDLRKGFEHNAYAFNWLRRQPDNFVADYNFVALHNPALNAKRWWPFNNSFTNWALGEITQAVKAQALFFTGQEITPEYIAEINRLNTDSITNDDVTGMQMDFGLTGTTLRLELRDGETLVIEMPLQISDIKD